MSKRQRFGRRMEKKGAVNAPDDYVSVVERPGDVLHSNLPIWLVASFRLLLAR